MLSKQDLGKYLKEIRETKKFSLREVDKLTNISYTHLNMIENGKRNVTPALLRNLAQLYNINYLDLYEKAGYIDLIQDENNAKDFYYNINDNNSDNVDKLVVSENIIPYYKYSTNSAVVFVYGSIPAGIPMECIEDIIDTEEISEDMLRGGKQFFGLRVKGNSMEPDYLDGDTLILEKSDDCESGDDCVVMVNGNDGTFKRVFKNENGIILQPLNSNYTPLSYTNEQIENLPVKIVGIVTEIRRRKRKV